MSNSFRCVFTAYRLQFAASHSGEKIIPSRMTKVSKTLLHLFLNASLLALVTETESLMFPTKLY